MKPVDLSDEKLDFRITVQAKWPNWPPGTKDISESFERADSAIEKYYEEEYRERDQYDMRSSHVEVMKGVEFEDVEPFVWGKITPNELAFSVYGMDAIREGYEELKEWFETYQNATVEEMVDFPQFRGFKGISVVVESDDNSTIITDPTKNPRRKHNDGPVVEIGKEPEGDRGIVRVDRWDIEYSVTDESDATVLFSHSDAHTVVLAEEIETVFKQFLECNRLLVADNAEIE